MFLRRGYGERFDATGCEPDAPVAVVNARLPFADPILECGWWFGRFMIRDVGSWRVRLIDNDF